MKSRLPSASRKRCYGGTTSSRAVDRVLHQAAAELLDKDSTGPLVGMAEQLFRAEDFADGLLLCALATPLVRQGVPGLRTALEAAGCPSALERFTSLWAAVGGPGDAVAALGAPWPSGDGAELCWTAALALTRHDPVVAEFVRVGQKLAPAPAGGEMSTAQPSLVNAVLGQDSSLVQLLDAGVDLTLPAKFRDLTHWHSGRPIIDPFEDVRNNNDFNEQDRRWALKSKQMLARFT